MAHSACPEELRHLAAFISAQVGLWAWRRGGGGCMSSGGAGSGGGAVRSFRRGGRCVWWISRAKGRGAGCGCWMQRRAQMPDAVSQVPGAGGWVPGAGGRVLGFRLWDIDSWLW